MISMYCSWGQRSRGVSCLVGHVCPHESLQLTNQIVGFDVRQLWKVNEWVAARWTHGGVGCCCCRLSWKRRLCTWLCGYRTSTPSDFCSSRRRSMSSVVILSHGPRSVFNSSVTIERVTSLFGSVFRWDQRLRPNGSTLVLVRSLD